MVLRRQFLLLVWSALLAAALPAQAGGSRVKDLVMVAGARDNQLVGYGLVTGLAGDGDKNPVYTLQSIANALQRYGITVPSATLSSKNVAAVMVTADIPAFKKPGTPDVTILAGDAKSLQGGVLLQTPCSALMGRSMPWPRAPRLAAFPPVWKGRRRHRAENHPTVAQIIGGALVEQEIPAEIIHENQMELLLRNPTLPSSPGWPQPSTKIPTRSGG